jgi:hypothetical protein
MPAGQAGDGSQQSASEAASQMAQRALARHPWLAEAMLLVRLGLLAGAGAGARLLAVPGPAEAVAAFAVATAVLSARSYRVTSPRARRRPRPAGAWQPGEQPPAGIPAATIEAATRVLAQLPRLWQGAWLQVAPCTDPVRHGQCRTAFAESAGGGMMRLVLGEHIAARPSDAAFVIAHEVRHPAGWTRHLSLVTFGARTAAWLAAGWAVPWPWLLVALAGIQIAWTGACWVTEAGCDIGGARVAGRDAALGFFAHRRALAREPKPGPAWKRRAHRALIHVAVPVAHPPWWLRAAVIRAVVPAGGPA